MWLSFRGQSCGKGFVFRNEYDQIGNLRAAILKAIMVALTKTARPVLLAGVQKTCLPSVLSFRFLLISEYAMTTTYGNACFTLPALFKSGISVTYMY